MDTTDALVAAETDRGLAHQAEQAGNLKLAATVIAGICGVILAQRVPTDMTNHPLHPNWYLTALALLAVTMVAWLPVFVLDRRIDVNPTAFAKQVEGEPVEDATRQLMLDKLLYWTANEAPLRHMFWALLFQLGTFASSAVIVAVLVYQGIHT